MSERKANYFTQSPLEAEFAFQLTTAGIEFEQEFKAVKGRKYRWDFLICGVLVELQGGTWNKKRLGHSTGSGLARDYRKNNLAVANGWRVLYFDAQMVRSGEALGVIIDMVRPRTNLAAAAEMLKDEYEAQADMQEEDE